MPADPTTTRDACYCLRLDCEVCARRTSAETRREVVSAHRQELLKAWNLALEVRLDLVDERLPEPLLFGRRRWRRIRDEARRILREEHHVGWAAILTATTVQEMFDAVKVRGPEVAANAAIAAARSAV